MSAQAAKTAGKQAMPYDEVPYESYAYPQTHPQHLSTVATLFGVKAADFRTARVLELGCAGGGNLFPLALRYPKATFVGIDLSKEQIAQANAGKTAMGLENVTFLHQNILEFTPPDSKAKFDYIICHGIFSWVPDVVRDRIMTLCRDWLSDNGVAIISYNALPGWNAVRSLREMMIFHTSRFATPDEKVSQARCLLDFLAENVPEGATGYRDVIEAERKMLKNLNNSYLYHDHLEGENTQFYLHEFVRFAVERGLEYVGDTNVTAMFVGNMPAKAMETLKVLNDVVSQEQYMDFITNRRFRSSILCRKGVKLNRNLRNDQIMDYYLTASPSLKADGVDYKKPINFTLNNGRFTTHDQAAGALFLELLAQGQRPIAATELVARVTKKLGYSDDAAVRKILVDQGLQLALRAYIQLHSDTIEHADVITDKPVAYALARYEAAQPRVKSVTNLYSQTLPCDAFSSIVIRHLDGQTDIPALLDILVEQTEKGTLKMEKEGVRITDPAVIRTHMQQALNDVLPKLLSNGLLVA